MFNDFMSFLADAFTGVGDIIVNVFGRLITIFWNTGNGITLWGVIFIIVLVFSIVIFFINEILKWVGVRGNNNYIDDEEEEW